ncbi:MAG: cysteine hydrolase [Deltaproteobacteria bacterium]|nr:cysteine hydrolase [Deltaproteobacteria bacterium]
MKPAIIVVDMLKDNMRPQHAISRGIRSILPSVRRLLSMARERGDRVVFACDSFQPDDFIFQGRMKPHCIQGTAGAEVIDELSPGRDDLILPKRRFSAFFQTGLEKTLRAQGVDTIAVAGVATHFCVLTTALDGICHDFKVIVIEDCCASYRAGIHQTTVSLYKRSPLHPLLRFMRLEEFSSLLEADQSEAVGEGEREPS